MVKEQLTGSMIDAGAELTKKLDESGLPVTTALWLFVSEVNEWRLLFASPDVGAKGPRDVYEKIQQAINQLGEKASAVPLSVVGLLDANDDHAGVLVKWPEISSGCPRNGSESIARSWLHGSCDGIGIASSYWTYLAAVNDEHARTPEARNLCERRAVGTSGWLFTSSSSRKSDLGFRNDRD